MAHQHFTARLRAGIRHERAQSDGNGAGRSCVAGSGIRRARTGPAQDEEFVLAHADNVEAAGLASHLKLPHYVDFQAELELLKRLQQEKNHG